jgi:hypothetical protein
VSLTTIVREPTSYNSDYVAEYTYVNRTIRTHFTIYTIFTISKYLTSAVRFYIDDDDDDDDDDDIIIIIIVYIKYCCI